MMLIAMPVDTCMDSNGNLMDGPHPADTMASVEQAEVADWAQARALQTRKDYRVFKLTEVLYYKGKR